MNVKRTTLGFETHRGTRHGHATSFRFADDKKQIRLEQKSFYIFKIRTFLSNEGIKLPTFMRRINIK